MNRDVVACLTPPGISAVAVIGLRGPSIWHKIEPYFKPAATFPHLHEHPKLYLGKLLHEGLGDAVVLSLQGDGQCQTIEVQAHGGPGVVQWILQFSESLGCQRITWQEWLEIVPATPPILSNSLWALLPQTITKKMASILLDQCQGAFKAALAAVWQKVESGSFEGSNILSELNALRRWESLGHHLLRPWQVVLIGKPNAGKSSLLNALLGFDRAITSPQPGTTRDLVSATLVWKGFPFELVDTAGIQQTIDLLEQAGIAQSRSAQRKADIVLGLIDLSDPRSQLPEDIQPTLVVGTKNDLPQQNTTMIDFSVSTISGSGLTELLDKILGLVVPEEPAPGQGIPVTDQNRQDLLILTERASRLGFAPS